MKIKILFLIFIYFFTAQSAAEELFEVNRNVRALGMGNAFTAISAGHSSLFYNPAGLARVKGLNWRILGATAGVSGLEAFADAQDLQTDDTAGQTNGNSGFADAIRNLYGDHVWLGGSGDTSFVMPYFGAALYYGIDASVVIDNPVYPNFDVNVTRDLGIAAGFALPLIPPVLDLGIVIRRITRTGSRVPFGPSFIGSLDADAISSGVEKEGIGYSADIGMNFFLPAVGDLVFSAVWQDIGETKYTPGSVEDEAPPLDRGEIILGLGFTFDSPLFSIAPALDFKHLNRSDVQLGKKIHFGVELGFPFLDVRAGMHQGYYTLGAGLDLGLIQVNAATWGVELGEYPGQIEDRRYMLEFALEVDFAGAFSFLSFDDSSSSGSMGKSERRRRKQRR